MSQLVQIEVKVVGVGRSLTIDITEAEYREIMINRDFDYLQEPELDIEAILLQSLEVNGNVYTTWLHSNGTIKFHAEQQ